MILFKCNSKKPETNYDKVQRELKETEKKVIDMLLKGLEDATDFKRDTGSRDRYTTYPTSVYSFTFKGSRVEVESESSHYGKGLTWVRFQNISILDDRLFNACLDKSITNNRLNDIKKLEGVLSKFG